MTERGFQPSEIKRGDYVLGGAVSLKGEALVPDGQWDKWLPPANNQNRDGFEPYDCVSQAVVAAVETLMNKEFSEKQNLSRRWLAWATGTEAKRGNDPTTVCTFLGKKGDVPEKDWPYPTPASDFYKTPPQNLWTLALEFPAEFEYDNQWLPATPEKMKDALTRSPLTVAGYAWEADANGLYYWPNGAQADHYFMLFGYEDGVAWHAFDSYENNYKRIAWDYPFIQVKEHTLHRNVVKPSAFALFRQWLREALGLQGTSFGAARSPRWGTVRRNHIAQFPNCAVCGRKGTTLKPNAVHHKVPFHKNPALELEESNLITLCQPHHLLFGHFMDWKSFNVNVESDSAQWLTSIETRPY